MKKRAVMAIVLLINLIYKNGVAQSELGVIYKDKVRIHNDTQTVVVGIRSISRTKAVSSKEYAWYKAGQLHYTQGAFSGFLLNGQYEAFHCNKQLKEKGTFNNGLKDGEWGKWTEFGVLSCVYFWKLGELNGPFRVCDPRGNVIRSGNYKRGKLHGKITQYFSEDSTTIIKYHRGKRLTPTPSKWKISNFTRWLSFMYPAQKLRTSDK